MSAIDAYKAACAHMLTCISLARLGRMKEELAHLRQENDRLRAELAQVPKEAGE